MTEHEDIKRNDKQNLAILIVIIAILWMITNIHIAVNENELTQRLDKIEKRIK